MEKKPNKKEELTLVNNVLKLATKLLKVSGVGNWEFLGCSVLTSELHPSLLQSLLCDSQNGFQIISMQFTL